MSLITIVTIGRENLAGMKRTFAGLASQSLRDVQHVVIDGGSSDGTADWVRCHLAFESTILVSEPDTGIYDAMNKGLALAEGKVVCFLNSGDLFATADVLEMVEQSYIADHWKWAFGLSMIVDEFFVPVRRQRLHSPYSWWRTTFWDYDISHQAVFMETELVRQMGGFDDKYSIAADYLLSLKVARVRTDSLALDYCTY